jgi:hypothetical protein
VLKVMTVEAAKRNCRLNRVRRADDRHFRPDSAISKAAALLTGSVHFAAAIL